VGLNAVLVDRARRVEVHAPVGAKVDGTPITRPVAGPWFRCRIEMRGAPEGRGPGGEPRRTKPTPTLIYRPRLPDGSEVGLDASDKLEVASDAYGTHVWRVVGDPEPWRKRRGVLALQATIERTDEHQMRPGP
jgi:hypothetical protein